MNIQLLGWETHGLRCPDISIELEQEGRLRKVALIQMPNGTGKTTTLRMLRATLSGEADRWNEEKVRSFRRPEATNPHGDFRITLRIDDKLLTFELKLDFEQGAAYYRTSSGGGIQKGWHPPPELYAFFNEKFVRLFILDGEFAEELMDVQKAEADRAIDALFQLYFFREIENLAEAEWQRRAKTAGKGTAGDRKQKQARVERLRSHIETVRKTRKKASTQLDATAQLVATLEKNIKERTKSDTALQQKLETAESNVDKTSDRLDEKAAAFLQVLREPEGLHPTIRAALSTLRQSLVVLKLPANTSREFFEELQEATVCICGRPLDEASRGAIAKNADLYLGEDVSGVINSLKEDVRAFVSGYEPGSVSRFEDSLAVLRSSVNARDEAEHQQSVLRAQLGEGGDEKLKKWAAGLVVAEVESKELNDLLDAINRPREKDDDDEVYCLDALKHLFKEAKNKFAEVTETLEIRQKTALLQEILRVAHDEARIAIQSSIVASCNTALKHVLARDPVRISSVEGAIQLSDRTGASMGQTLALGYVFLTELLHRSAHQFPLLVDSPALAIDGQIRRKIGSLVPKLCEQFVALTITVEREYFVESLDAAADGDVDYFTLFRKTAGTEPLIAALPKDGVQQTENGVLVRNREYFFGFDIEEED